MHRVTHPPRTPMLLGWLGDHCEVGPHCSSSSGDLWRSFSRYAWAQGEMPCSGVANFRWALRRLGFMPIGKGSGARGFIGLRVRSHPLSSHSI